MSLPLAVIFDLNGVFIKSPPLSKRFEADYGVPIDTFLPALNSVMDKVRIPNAPSTYALFQPHLQTWNIKLTEHEFYAYWFTAEKPDEQMIELATQLREQGIQVFALSNNFRERATYYQQNFPFITKTFDEIFYSWQTSLVKPNPACWLSILQKYNLTPSNVIYFDDSTKNVETAKSLGITAHPFENVAQVRSICGLCTK